MRSSQRPRSRAAPPGCRPKMPPRPRWSCTRSKRSRPASTHSTRSSARPKRKLPDRCPRPRWCPRRPDAEAPRAERRGRSASLTEPAAILAAVPDRLPPPGPSFLREHEIRVREHTYRAGMGRPSDAPDGWWLTLMWVADDEGVVSFRDVAPASRAATRSAARTTWPRAGWSAVRADPRGRRPTAAPGGWARATRRCDAAVARTARGPRGLPLRAGTCRGDGRERACRDRAGGFRPGRRRPGTTMTGTRP